MTFPAPGRGYLEGQVFEARLDLDVYMAFPWDPVVYLVGGALNGPGRRRPDLRIFAPGFRRLHLEVLGLAGPGKAARWVVDHVNGDPLDNRRTNLRVVSRRENRLNSAPSWVRLRAELAAERAGLALDDEGFVVGWGGAR